MTNDWGLELLKFSSSKQQTRATGIHLQPTPPLNRNSKSLPLSIEGRFQYKGLRPKLFFNDPTIYYIAIFINFVLRFTWSLKLSSHLHHVADLELGVFMMEALEVLRRWIWVFLRVEWETVRPKGNAAGSAEEYEFLMHEVGESDISDNASSA